MLSSHNSIRKLFPFTEKFIYFDAAHFTPYPLNVVSKINEFISKYTTSYLNLSSFNNEISAETRETCAKLINTEAENIAITSNTTHGINIFANGISLEKDDCNIAFLDSEFPSVVYPWLNQESLGKVQAFLIPSDKGYTNETVIKKMLMENNIRVLTLSYVQFLGYRYNVKNIAEFCKKNNILLAVDAIQATGVCPVNIQQMSVDYLSTGNQKWLMSPAGTGFTYISKKYREIIHPSYVGTMNVNYNFDNFLDYKLDLINSSAAYENSTPNTLGMIGMNEAVKMLLELGVENIFSHILEIQDKLIELLDKSKYRVESVLMPEHRSNILIFSHIDSTKNLHIRKTLDEKKIYIALREGYLRIAPHIYNNFSDVEILAKELSSF